MPCGIETQLSSDSNGRYDNKRFCFSFAGISLTEQSAKHISVSLLRSKGVQPGHPKSEHSAWRHHKDRPAFSVNSPNPSPMHNTTSCRHTPSKCPALHTRSHFLKNARFVRNRGMAAIFGTHVGIKAVPEFIITWFLLMAVFCFRTTILYQSQNLYKLICFIK